MVQKYLKNKETGNVFVFTEQLAASGVMVPCDAKGKVLAADVDAPGASESVETVTSPVEEVLPQHPTLEDYKKVVDGMTVDELKAKAIELEIEFAPNIGAEKLKTRILEAVEDRLAAPAAEGGV